MKQQPRPVKFTTTFEVLKKRPALLILGTVSIGFGTFFLLIMTLIASNSKDDATSVDYEQLMSAGQSTRGTVIRIQTQSNISINDEHPSIIWYTYVVEGDTIKDKFQTLAPDEVSRMDIGDEVPVKYLNGQSIITSLEPFQIPFVLFGVGGVFILVGIGFWAIAFLLASKETKLYKVGVVENAEVIAVMGKSGGPVTRYAKSLKVHYQYMAGNPRRNHVGESIVTDPALVNALKNGDVQVKVFVLPYNASRSIIIPRLEAIRNNWQIEANAKTRV